MNAYVKEFVFRGLICAGFGPVVMGIIFWTLSLGIPAFSITGGEILLAIVSSYLLAFLHAGASVFWSIEHWQPLKALAFHFLTLYFAYSTCYLVNSWIPFEVLAFLFFSAIFLAVYVVVFIFVLIAVRITQNRLNKRLKGQ